MFKVNMVGESFPSTPSSLYAPDTEEETDNLASCSCSPNRFVMASVKVITFWFLWFSVKSEFPPAQERKLTTIQSVIVETEL